MRSYLGLVRGNWRAYWAEMAFVSDALIIVTSVALASGRVHLDLPTTELLRTHGILCLAVLVVPLSLLVSRGVYRRISNLSWNFKAPSRCKHTRAALLLECTL